MPGEYDYLYKYLEEDKPVTDVPEVNGVVDAASLPPGHVANIVKAPEGPGVIGTIKDIAHGINQGAAKAVKETAGIAQSVLPSVFGEPGTGEMNAVIANNKTKTVAGNVAAGVSQFVTGFVGYGRVIKSAGIVYGAGKAALAARGLAQGAAADATVFDPQQDRLSNLVEEHPSLHNPITAYLASDPSDSNAEGRFKNALEGLALGKVTEGLFSAVRGLRTAYGLLSTKGEAAAITHLNNVAESIASPSAASSVTESAPKVAGASAVTAPAVAPKDLLSEEAKASLIADIKAPKPDAVLSTQDFNYSKMDSPEGAKQVMDEMSKALAPQIDAAKGGVQTLKDIEEMATVLGETPDSLMGQIRAHASGANELAARFIAGKRMMQSMAREVSDLAKKVDFGNPEARPQLDAMINRMSNLQTDLKAIQTSSARTTSAGRIRTLDSFSPQDIRALIAADGDMSAVAGIVRTKSLLQRGTEAYTEYWINAILSNPVTHAKNILSNAFNSVALPGRQMIGGLAGFDIKQAKEGLSTFVGLMSNARDSWALAKKSFLLEDSIIANTGKMEAGNRATGNTWLGKTIRLSSRFLTAEDEFFKQINYRANLKAKLTSQGIDKGLQGDELAQFISTEFDKGFEAKIVNGKEIQGAGLDTDSLNYAKAVTFTDDLDPNSLVSKISALSNQHPAFKLVVPFIRTPWNILKSTARLTPPLEALRSEFYQDLKVGGARRADALGRLTMGGSLYSLGYAGAANGVITGDGPKDPSTRKALINDGWQPRSIKIGGNYVSYDGIEPASTIFSLVANYHEVSAYMKEKDRDEFATAMVSAVAKTMVNKTYLRGIADVIGVLDDPDRNGSSFIGSRVASNVPFSGLSTNIRNQVDPVRRAMNDWMDTVKNTIPGWSSTLPPQRNIFGDVVKSRQAVGPDMFSPFTSATALGDQVTHELATNAVREGGFAMPSKKYGNVQFTPEQYDKVLQTMGSMGNGGMKEELKKLITSPDYKELKDSRGIYKSAKREAIERILGMYENGAKLKVIDGDKSLKAQVELDSKNKMAAKGNAPEQIQPLDALQKLIQQPTQK